MVMVRHARGGCRVFLTFRQSVPAADAERRSTGSTVFRHAADEFKAYEKAAYGKGFLMVSASR